ncbi:hypothetical protein HPB50_015574 [Hyalomma asiaticum]|uniref:Uncharacterized protein n=2 Tax=Hyalomma asiaticum TaxID=266040 RepID=A0ACB7S999_HYAAI|nr:hypothetical protein HPB50_011685 [Hyalomma asiaticum]KAH6930626.1 hypothetical protein HPB50_015574 [Hyalomma asiaticum]
MRCVVLLQLAAAVFLLLPGQSEAAAGGRGRRVVRYRCQYLRTHNRTKIVCSPVEVYNQPKPGSTLTSVSMQPEAFNGQGAQKGRVCHKLRELAERLASFEEGAWKYCDPSSCLRESPHCTNSVLSTECSQCLGRCWIMYAFPGVRADSKAKDFPCDPLECGGAHIFCGGYKFKDD